MQKLNVAAQGFLGLIFLVFGLNGFLNFIPLPPPPSDAAGAFMGGLAGSGYFFPVLKMVEIVGGILLLVRKFSPLALVLLAPIVVQILLYHIFLAPDLQGMIMAVLLTVIEAYLGFVVYKDRFKSVLAP